MAIHPHSSPTVLMLDKFRLLRILTDTILFIPSNSRHQIAITSTPFSLGDFGLAYHFRSIRGTITLLRYRHAFSHGSASSKCFMQNFVPVDLKSLSHLGTPETPYYVHRLLVSKLFVWIIMNTIFPWLRFGHVHCSWKSLCEASTFFPGLQPPTSATFADQVPTHRPCCLCCLCRVFKFQCQLLETK